MKAQKIIIQALHDNFSEFTEDQASAVIEALKLEGFVLVPKVITDEWMATHVNQVIGNYCKDYEDLPFAVDESELPELKENFRLTIRSAHKRLMKVVEAQEQSHEH